MSNSLAIASVTATLRWLLDKIGKIPEVTVLPLDKASEGIHAQKPRINLFLYQALPDAAFRNMDMPGRMKSGETGHPPLPLTLYYLLTAYSGDERDEMKSHALLGKAMGIFHDHPVLGEKEVRQAWDPLHKELGDIAFVDQVERIRITLQPLLFEEMSKLWTTFQIHYRLSAAYQVSVVLIESARPTRTPLPVLIRQIDVQASMMLPFPTLTEIRVPNREPSERLKTLLGLPEQQPSAELGDELVIKGHHLQGKSLEAHLANPQLKEPMRIQIKAGTGSEFRATVPDDPVGLPAGFYTLSTTVVSAGLNGEKKLLSNALSLSIAPTIEDIKPKTVQQNAVLTIKCHPQVRAAQRVALLFGEQELLPELPKPRPAQTDTLKFRLKNIEPGTYFLRLRVDGVDSVLINLNKFDEKTLDLMVKKWRESNIPPQFYDETKKVTVQ